MRALVRLLSLSVCGLTFINCSSSSEGPGVGAPPPPSGGSANQATGGGGTGGSGGSGGGVVPGTAGSELGGSASQSSAGAGGSGGGGDTSTVGGSAGTGGSAGAAGGAHVAPNGPTAGCQAPDPVEEPQVWLQRDITVANLPTDKVAMFAQRKYFVRLPVDYDHTRPYPIVFYAPGCTAANVEPTPMMNQIKNDAIHVFLLQVGQCFSTGYPSPEVPYFTQALDEVQAKYCTDAGKVFVSGYSSGSWLSSVLACAMGDRIRAIGTAAGGLRKATIDGYMCNTPAAGIFYTGENDMENPADRKDETGFQYGVMGARDRLLSSNGCDLTAAETYADNPICQIWKKGCESNPVLYCVGPGDTHGNGSGNYNVSNKTFWDIWSALPAR
jgi:hypothetical protein